MESHSVQHSPPDADQHPVPSHRPGWSAQTQAVLRAGAQIAEFGVITIAVCGFVLLVATTLNRGDLVAETPPAPAPATGGAATNDDAANRIPAAPTPAVQSAAQAVPPPAETAPSPQPAAAGPAQPPAPPAAATPPAQIAPPAQALRYGTDTLRQAAELGCQFHPPMCDLLRQAAARGVLVEFGALPGPELSRSNPATNTITISTTLQAETPGVLAAKIGHELKRLAQPPTTSTNWVDLETEATEFECAVWVPIPGQAHTPYGYQEEAVVQLCGAGKVREWVSTNPAYQGRYQTQP